MPKSICAIPVLLTTATFSLFSTALFAEGFEQHSAHEHGSAILNLVQEGPDLQIELNTPAANILGFEHAPETDEQSMIAARAHETLEAPRDLFHFPAAANCKLISASIDAEVLSGSHASHSEEHHGDHEKDRHHDEHDGEKHGHHDEHDGENEHHAMHDKEEGHHDEHDEEHGHHNEHDGEKHGHHGKHDGEHEESVHSDIIARYSYKCQNSASLKFVDVLLFKVFPGFEEIDSQVISKQGQKAIELTSRQFRIQL